MRSVTIERASSRFWLLKSVINAALIVGAGILLIFLLGVAQRRGWITSGSAGTLPPSGGAELEYTCTMHPQIRQPTPGRCPICGMELILAGATTGDQDDYAVHVDPVARRLANIETVAVEAIPLTETLRTPGFLQVDESRQAIIAAYTNGRIEQMFADYTGVEVEAGQHMVVLYSPDLYAAQSEYLESQRTLREMQGGGLATIVESQNRLVAGLRQRLIELGMTETQLQELEQSRSAKARLTIYAPIGGTVIRKEGVRGEYVETGQTIYEIADLSTVWLMLELFPEDAARVRFGQRVRAEFSSLPGETISGRVAFIDKTVDPKTRTVGVRVEVSNSAGRLRPGDYATALLEISVSDRGEVFDADLAGKWISPMHPQVIRDEPGECPICGMELVSTQAFGYTDQPIPQPTALVVPRNAILQVGDHSVVYIETEPGRFELRPVKLGAITEEYASIVEGLAPGDQVATAGNFLIDSQMQLLSKPSLIDPTRSVPKKEGPLDPGPIQVVQLRGEPGVVLERLYAAYLDLQTTFADDKAVNEDQVSALRDAAENLLTGGGLPADLVSLVDTIQAESAHLHHLDLAEARAMFKPVSHAVIRLAARVRGEQATVPLLQMYCPMVKGGGGDWLQVSEPLLNPYWGEAMLHCGEVVRELPPQGQPQE